MSSSNKPANCLYYHGDESGDDLDDDPEAVREIDQWKFRHRSGDPLNLDEGFESLDHSKEDLPHNRPQDHLPEEAKLDDFVEAVASVSLEERPRPAEPPAPVQVIPHNGRPFYNWQATKTTVQERFAFMFNNEILSDVHFVVGRGDTQQRIPAHKFVLAVGSAVFDAMFNGTLATSAAEIELPDVEPAAFLALLRFLYSDHVQIGPETVMTTLYSAKKYAVPALERRCVEFLQLNLGPDNAFMLLTQARLFDESHLGALCLDTIDKNTSEALNADGFTDVDIATLSAVLVRDTLQIKESKLFKGVVRWAEAECRRKQLLTSAENMRTVLGPALNLIRFPLMPLEEFASGPAQSGILTDREIVSLFLYFTVNPKPSISFNCTPRCSLAGKEQTISRFQKVTSRWGYTGTSDRIRFSVNRKVFVVGFGLYGAVHGPADYSVIMKLIHSHTDRILGSNSTRFSCDGSRCTFRVMFKEPVEVLPNTLYTALVTLDGRDSYYGINGLKRVSVDCPSGGKVMFQFTYAGGDRYNGTTVEQGQIPEILFYT